jgi:D-specific alpha-keto acid dehydrogenase
MTYRGALVGLTIYGCEPDEAELFRQLAPQRGIVMTFTEAPVEETNVDLAAGNHCISVGHKTAISNGTLLALRRVGVRYVCTRSVGFNHLDVQYAASVGISVGNIVYSPDSVADYTLMLILMLLRDAKSTLGRVQARDYRLGEAHGKELRDLTVGVVGTGRIGAAVMDRLRGFGCQVLAYDRCPEVSREFVSLDALLEQSDVVTLHTPLTTDTHHLLSRRRIDRMRPGAFVINTGRGSLVDTSALLAALEDGRLGGAALDVVEGEEGIFYADHRARPIANRLLTRLQALPHVVITPHTAYYTEHALTDIVENTLLNCLRFERAAA